MLGTRTLDGDEIIAQPKAVATDSIVIDAPASAVWPWFLQMGRGRAGWYSYDLLDNGGVPSKTEISPELQDVAIGDVWPASAEGVDGFTVMRLEAPRVLVLGALIDTEHDRALALDAIKPERFWEVSWAFVLEPLGDARTRLWARARADCGPDAPWRRVSTRVLGLAHHFMEREQLHNLKLRAEGNAGRSGTMLDDAVEASVGVAAMLANLVTPFLRDARSHWGMTKEEADRSYPGDGLMSRPSWQWTHAVEVDAPVSKVWPWVAQIGQGKAGFYSYQLLENIVGCEIQNAERIHAEWQAPRVGDGVRLHPEMPPIEICEVVPQHHLLIAARLDPKTGKMLSGDSQGGPFVSLSWLFALEERPSGRTRVISRFRFACSDQLRTRLIYGPWITESIGFVMDRRMLLGIKERSERVALRV